MLRAISARRTGRRRCGCCGTADRASALRVLEADLSSRQAAHKEAVREAYGPWNGPLAESMVDGLVARHGISYADAVAVATAERELARVRAEFAPPVSTVPWLDGRELAAPPRPWSDDDFARDELRAQHAGVDQFDESLWRLYAEQGKDAVHELVVERRDREVERAEAELSVTLEMALEAASTARADAKAAAEPAREPVARARRMGPF
jgi:hypothetical protein